MKDFMDYFEDLEDYPRTIAGNILPINTKWSYVSSTFLNSFINYANIIKAFVISRYTSWNNWDTDDKLHIQDPPGSLNWVYYTPNSKLEAYKKVTEPKRLFHTKLDCLNDDILILSEIELNFYCYFWFDMDVSDCCIGRFTTIDSKQEVINNFSNFCQERSNDLSMDYLGKEEEAKELPLHFFTGWLKF